MKVVWLLLVCLGLQISYADKVLTGNRSNWITRRAYRRATLARYHYYKYVINYSTILDFGYISFTEAFQTVKTRYANIMTDAQITEHFDQVKKNFEDTKTTLSDVKPTFDKVVKFYEDFYTTMHAKRVKVFNDIRTSTSRRLETCITSNAMKLWNALDNVRYESFNCHAIYRDARYKFRDNVRSQSTQLQVIMAGYASTIAICYGQQSENDAKTCIKKAISSGPQVDSLTGSLRGYISSFSVSSFEFCTKSVLQPHVDSVDSAYNDFKFCLEEEL